MTKATGLTESREWPGGSLPGEGTWAPAFVLAARDALSVPVFLAVPHAGRRYPATLSAMMRDPEAATLRLEDRYIDLVAKAVARETGAGLLVATAPRAMIDLNRSPDDVDWDMVAGAVPRGVGRLAAGRRARGGLGLVPRRLPGLGEIWRRRITAEELAERIEQVHRPYHAALAARMEALRDRWGAALLIDLHSMPPLAAGSAEIAPVFVIGDRFGASANAALSAAALEHLASDGWPVAHNRPYAGGHALDRHGAPTRGLHAIQVEVCRSAYLDRDLREPGPGLAATARSLAGLVRRMAQELSARSLPQAAE